MAKLFLNILKPPSPASPGSWLSTAIATLLSQTQLTCTQQVKDLSMGHLNFQLSERQRSDLFAHGSLNTLNSLLVHTATHKSG